MPHMRTRRTPVRDRWAAKLLFQFRVVADGRAAQRRVCEERTIVFRAVSAKDALSLARRRGKSAQFRYRNDAGSPVRFEFVGVLDLLHLGLECQRDEVWYEIRQRLRPMERRKTLLPPERALLTAASVR